MSDVSREQARKAMQEKLAEAERLIAECVKLAEEHKICFSQPSYGGYGRYTPSGRERGDEESERSDSLDLSYPGEWTGWQSSDFCY